ncbi:MAG: hypothetical protein QXD59_07525, partial [Candidatus Caldarchaeum sp.]
QLTNHASEGQHEIGGANETLTEYYRRAVGFAGVGSAGCCPCPHFRRTAERRKAGISGLSVAYRDAYAATLSTSGYADTPTHPNHSTNGDPRAKAATKSHSDSYRYACSYPVATASFGLLGFMGGELSRRGR